MSKVLVSLACGSYDRTQALLDRRVEVEGCDTVCFPLRPEEIFYRAFRNAEFDVAELSFSTYLATTADGTCPYIGVPAFVSRSFRHSAIYVRRDAGIRHPQDLIGRRVGVPEYQVTAAVWVRAMLEQDFGVRAADILWVTGGVEEPGRHEKVALSLPPDIVIEPAGKTKALGDMLLRGEIDALVCPRAPSCFEDGGQVIRLFEDPSSAAADYFQRHQIFPIMHLIGVRRELADRHPWLPGSVYKAFLEAKAIAFKALEDTTALAVSLPFAVEELERTRRLMGQDLWAYGVEANSIAIEAILDQHFRQGLSSRRLRVQDVFHPATLDRFRI